MKKIVKHMVKMTKAFAVRAFCRHAENQKGSCPFTGRTYTVCVKCKKRLAVEITKNEQ
jgi:hypothetical protein